jgi:hypothetical protein
VMATAARTIANAKATADICDVIEALADRVVSGEVRR